MAVQRSLGVFCGSSFGARPDYDEAARETGRVLADHDITLVYGGARVGTMGTVADAVLAGGGRVVGIIPDVLADREIAHDGLTELHVVASMGERKQLMAERSDGFLALPGGLGTLEELFEMMVRTQLGLHAKPAGLLNVLGYYDQLAAFLRHAAGEGLVRDDYLEHLHVDDDVERLVHLLVPPATT